MQEKLLGEYAWFNANASGQTHTVAQKRPNVWGLYDMYGNVWEWCQDWYERDYYRDSPGSDPTGPPVGSLRAFRGGCACDAFYGVRTAFRRENPPGHRDIFIGFRVSRVLADKSGE